MDDQAGDQAAAAAALLELMNDDLEGVLNEQRPAIQARFNQVLTHNDPTLPGRAHTDDELIARGQFITAVGNLLRPVDVNALHVIPEYLVTDLATLFGFLFRSYTIELAGAAHVWQHLYYIIIGLCLQAQFPGDHRPDIIITANIVGFNLAIRHHLSPNLVATLLIFLNYCKFIIISRLDNPFVGGSKRKRSVKRSVKRSGRKSKRSGRKSNGKSRRHK